MRPQEPALPHPTDELIVRLVRGHEAVVTPDDVAAIVERIATASFSRRMVRLRSRDRELTYGGVALGRMADSLALHLAKRVQLERQWIAGTTADDYLVDLRAAARHPRERVLVYERSAEIFAATITPTLEIVPGHRRGTDWLPHLIVVHSALNGPSGTIIRSWTSSSSGRLTGRDWTA